MPKNPVIKGAEITDDGYIIVEFNKKVYPHTAKCIFDPVTLFNLAEDAEIPAKEDTEFPGIPLVEGEIEIAEEKGKD